MSDGCLKVSGVSVKSSGKTLVHRSKEKNFYLAATSPESRFSIQVFNITKYDQGIFKLFTEILEKVREFQLKKSMVTIKVLIYC